MLTFEEYLNERVYKGLKADLTKGKPHWDELSKEEQGNYILIDSVAGKSFRWNGYRNLEDLPFIMPNKWVGNITIYFGNNMKDLVGFPEIIDGDFSIESNKTLTSLKNFPKQVNKLVIYNTELQDLNGITGHANYIKIENNKNLTDITHLKNINIKETVIIRNNKKRFSLKDIKQNLNNLKVSITNN